jgi:hypothetical protein
VNSGGVKMDDATGKFAETIKK